MLIDCRLDSQRQSENSEEAPLAHTVLDFLQFDADENIILSVPLAKSSDTDVVILKDVDSDQDSDSESEAENQDSDSDEESCNENKENVNPNEKHEKRPGNARNAFYSRHNTSSPLQTDLGAGRPSSPSDQPQQSSIQSSLQLSTKLAQLEQPQQPEAARIPPPIPPRPIPSHSNSLTSPPQIPPRPTKPPTAAVDPTAGNITTYSRSMGKRSRESIFDMPDDEVEQLEAEETEVRGKCLSRNTLKILEDSRHMISAYLVKRCKANKENPFDTCVLFSAREVPAYVGFGTEAHKVAEHSALTLLWDYKAIDAGFALEPLWREPVDQRTALTMLDLLDHWIREGPKIEKLKNLRAKVGLRILQHTGMRPSSVALHREFDPNKHCLHWRDIHLRYDPESGGLTAVIDVRSMKGQHNKDPNFVDIKVINEVGDLRLSAALGLIAWGMALGVIEEDNIAEMMRGNRFVVKQNWLNRPVLAAITASQKLDPQKPMKSNAFGDVLKRLANGIGINPLKISAKSFRKGFADHAITQGESMAQVALNHKQGTKVTRKHYTSGRKSLALGNVWRKSGQYKGMTITSLILKRPPGPAPLPSRQHIRQMREAEPEFEQLQKQTAEAKTEEEIAAAKKGLKNLVSRTNKKYRAMAIQSYYANEAILIDRDPTRVPPSPVVGNDGYTKHRKQKWGDGVH
ncbi:hypothetical protein HK097_007299 [Rhizophlyctis rosea]|uniref:Tyr recombinase domain-containing protein n=1 Tax=Rhizophlyctis rosea TaxID=64517 RepID=A0AAD5SC20_9FUNG|nr:hypothetical protein HK097_007299 [Rhizophlyctis rosea]